MVRMLYRRTPPLHALTAFEAAARHESFSKAAAELYLTHSAISHRIRILEEDLGVRLFLRLNKKVVLTPKGEAFLAVVRDALTKLHQATSQVKKHTRRRLRVSVLPAFASSWLIQRLGDFYRSCPDIDLEIQATGQLANLKSGEVDVGIRYGAGDWPGLRAERLFSDVVYPVASPEYLASRRSIRTPEELQGAVLLRNPRLPWKPWFQAAGLDWPEPTSGPIYSDVGLMLEAAAIGQGVALARHVLVTEPIQEGRLMRLTDVIAPSHWHFYLAFAPQALEREEVTAFVHWILERAQSEPLQDPVALTSLPVPV